MQDLADADPHVLAGDFNFMPDSPQYRLMTTGTLEEASPDYPPMPPGENWRPILRAPLKSALRYHTVVVSIVYLLMGDQHKRWFVGWGRESHIE